jgi:nucleoside-diphosphate-sugar epimerase
VCFTVPPHACTNSTDLPVNIGNPSEYTVLDFANLIKAATQSSSKIITMPATADDPHMRKPDISVAKRELGWEPRVPVQEGITHTVKYFKSVLEAGEITPTGPEAARPRKNG